MKRCSYCGVELEENANYCSLCGEPFNAKEQENQVALQSRKKSSEEKLMSDYQKLSVSQKRKIFNKITAIILFSGMLITMIIDLIMNNTISWSQYPLAIAPILLFNIIITSLISGRAQLWMLLSFLSLSGLLLILDSFTGSTGWGLSLGIPLLLSSYVLIFSICKIIAKTPQKGLNIIAYAILGSGVFCLFVDGIISFYHKDPFLLGWSLIVIAAAVFIALLLLYIHYRLKKVTDLRRFFHI
ncbi:DUF6320 domain-containing protein [Thermophagus sp. OGC60D27]|uniref:DUF6320 domain-containing protein n=1 Tax=Thermophagus sp. OGC60D27 TaxID=3458415 RepID=UPI0040383277